MHWLNAILAVYAVLLAAGGAYGYLRAGSLLSLGVSVAAAALIALGLYITRTNKSAGYSICLVVASALSTFFFFRVREGSTMPGIPGLAMSVIAMIALIIGHSKVQRS